MKYHIIRFVVGICSILSNTSVWAKPVVYDPVWDVEYHGVSSSSHPVELFYGVQYAEDTSGKNRFAPPRPRILAPGSKLNVSKHAPACPQLQIALPPFFDKPEQISEDCLSLFIARPCPESVGGEASLANLPVLAWVHGGGFVYGSGTDSHTSPLEIIKLSLELQSPVIFIGVNYRLGMLGFAASPELQNQRSENVGLRDQRLAFEWIKEHINAFGGDPNRITAYGLSAGGTSISLHHILCGGEKGAPFDRAFMMSGPTGTLLNATSNESERNTLSVATKLGCDPSGSKATIDCLRDVPLTQLIETSYGHAMENFPPLGLFTFLPKVDGDIFPQPASHVVRARKAARNIPTILAWTEDEAGSMVAPPHAVQSEAEMLMALKQWTAGLLSPGQISRLLELYPASAFEDRARAYNNGKKSPESPPVSAHFYRLTSFIRDMLFVCSSIDFANHTLQASRALDPSFDQMYLYQLNSSVLNPIWDEAGMSYLGTAHGSDTNYIFNGVFPEGSMSTDDVRLARQFSTTLIEFAYSGKPISRNKSRATFHNWHPAFDNADTSKLGMLSIGGPFGTASVVLDEEAESNRDVMGSKLAQAVENIQQVVVDAVNFGAMSSASVNMVSNALGAQDLFRRCDFVNSLTDTLGQ